MASNMASGFDDIDMIDDPIVNPIIFNNSNENNKVKGQSIAYSMLSSRFSSSFSDKSVEKYAARVQRESNSMDQDNPAVPTDSPQIEYEPPKEKDARVSKAADSNSNMRKQYSQSIALALNNSTAEDNGNIFNVQLNYDVNQALDLESWDGDFKTISLHGSIEHLASDIKNIKDLLLRMQNYILSKSIEGDKANNIKNLKEVSKVAWGFISVFYESYWDSLMVDSTNRSFRNNVKVKSKFSPQINKELSTPKGKNTSNSSYVFSLLPLIPAKLTKEVNEISKYFKKNASSNQKNLTLKHQQTTLTYLILLEILLNSRKCSQSCKTKKLK